jgi:subtilisin family serine protease
VKVYPGITPDFIRDFSQPRAPLAKPPAPVAGDAGRSNLPVVVVLDGGVDYTHTDLDEAMWVNPGEIAGDRIDNDGNGFVDDIHGVHVARQGSGDPFQGRQTRHGTHVAGIIAAEDNGEGNTGIAAGKAKVMSISGLYDDRDALTATERAINYIVKMKQEYGVNIRVVNCSFGNEQPTAEERQRSEQMFQKLADADILVVAATSNGGRDTDGLRIIPAYLDHPNIITVAAMDRNDQRLAHFSSWGDQEVDIAAPGDNILSTVPGNFLFRNPHRTQSGTSMAAPHVAGAAALMFEKNPELTAVQAREILMRTAEADEDLIGRVATGAKLDIDAAVHAAEFGLPEIF